jgi:hypothetical protein
MFSSVHSKEYQLPKKPTRLAMRQYKWNEDQIQKENVLELHSKSSKLPETSGWRSETRNYQHSAIPPPSSLHSLSLEDLSVEHTKEASFNYKVIREVAKTPKYTVKGKIIEDGKDVQYYIDGRKVNEAHYRSHFG